MAKLSSALGRIVVLVVVAAVAVGAVLYFVVFSGPDDKTVSARFPSAVGIYPGTPVRILGVQVGKVTSVKPRPTYVEVRMNYGHQYTLPSNAKATEVANSLVSDRYIDLTAYTGKGPTMRNGAAIPTDRTYAPAEIDDIYKALNSLSVALGPKGANKNGALSTLLRVGAANLKGNGADLGRSINKLSQAATTLSNGREDLFGTVRNLQKFTKALSDSDGQVRLFNKQLAQVAGDLADERTDLGAALRELGLALDKVNGFVKKNAGRFHTDISGLREITGVLVKQKASLTETLAVAPAALANLVHSYQPNLGVLATRGNLSSLLDPGQLCGILNAVGNLLKPGGALTSLNGLLNLGDLLGPLTGTIATSCQKLLSGNPNILPDLEKFFQQEGTSLQKVAGDLRNALGKAVNGGLGGIIGAGA